LLGGQISDLLAIKAGVPLGDDEPPEPEIGRESLSPERVEYTLDDLKRTPPLPVDLTRKLNVFITRVQYVELKVQGYQLSRRRAELSEDFVGMASKDLKERVTGRIRTPLDTIKPLDVEIVVRNKKEIISVDEKFLKEERQVIERTLTHVMPKRGRIILRANREAFDYQIERFEAIIKAYQLALKGKMEEAREDFRESFVKEFLDRWRIAPPRRLSMDENGPTEENLKTDIENEADKLFDKIVKLDGPDITVNYKDIAIEDLKDKDFMKSLRNIMSDGGVKDADLDRLFEHGEAAAGQRSFELERPKA
jgi:hypothetical protein